MNKSVCRYYLQGNCRYGDQCRQAHENAMPPTVYRPNVQQPRPRLHQAPVNSKYHFVAPSVATTNNHRQNSRTFVKPDSQYSPLLTWVTGNFTNKSKAVDVLGQMQIEAITWLKSSLWRFTSRSLFPGGRPLEHWTDQSFEELRWAHRWMTNKAEDHLYKKAYSDYWEVTQRELNGVSTLHIETIESLKTYIDEYIASNHKPSRVLASDVDMKDDNDNTTSNSNIQSTNYTENDQLLADERAAFESETFELGSIPDQPPSRQYC